MKTHSLGSLLALVGALASLACSVPLVAGLDEADASQVVVALEQNGIASEKDRDPDQVGTFRVVVSKDDQAAALTLLAEEGLPARQAPGILEALGKGSLVPSRAAEHARVVTGTGDELERSLRGLDGVLSARVHLGVPAHDPLALGEEQPAAKASVLIRHRGSTPPMVAGEVQRLVAGAVPGLAPEQVSVVMLSAPARTRGPERQLARLGPLTVARGSLSALRAMVGLAILLDAALLACVVALWARLRRAEQQPEPPAHDPNEKRPRRAAS